MLLALLKAGIQLAAVFLTPFIRKIATHLANRIPVAPAAA